VPIGDPFLNKTRSRAVVGKKLGLSFAGAGKLLLQHRHEAAFEAVMVAASFVVGAGDAVQINVPSDARMRGTDKVDRRAEEVSAFFK
jgi:hypothetical protein